MLYCIRCATDPWLSDITAYIFAVDELGGWQVVATVTLKPTPAPPAPPPPAHEEAGNDSKGNDIS